MVDSQSNGSITLDNTWYQYGNCKKTGTTGWFASSSLPIAWRYTTICVWFTPSWMHSHIRLQISVFWGEGGPIALHGMVHFLSTTTLLLPKVVYTCSDSSWYIHTHQEKVWPFHFLREWDARISPETGKILNFQLGRPFTQTILSRQGCGPCFNSSNHPSLTGPVTHWRTDTGLWERNYCIMIMSCASCSSHLRNSDVDLYNQLTCRVSYSVVVDSLLGKGMEKGFMSCACQCPNSWG